MKKEARNYLEAYANIMIYVFFIMATVVVGNLFGAWYDNTPQAIIFIMCLLILFDIIRQAMIDPKKGANLRKVILGVILILLVIGVLAFIFMKWNILGG
jgi:hypothetical protein